MSVQIQTVTIDDCTMDYFRFGRGRKALAILPGLSVQSVMGAADAVAQAYRLFADDYTVYVFDRRKELPDAYTVRAMARDAARAIRACIPDRICLFGASQGGMIAMQIAIERPELVQKLALGSTCCRVTPERFRTVEQWIALARSGDATELYLAFGQALYPPELFAQSKQLFAQAADAVTREELDHFIVLAEGMKDFDVTEDLGRIACPTLVIGSSDDRVLGADASVQLAERLGGRPDAELFMYDGFGHAAYDAAPDYAERLLRFFAD